MKFTETSINGAWVIDLERRQDERGFFARSFCAREFEERGIDPTILQCNVSYNYKKGTLRGMHYQLPPAAEPKLIRCTRGAIHDVIIDMRPDSPSYLRHFAVELTADNRRALYVPDLCAHGYQTLTDDAEAMYQVSEFYSPGYERGIRYNDPALGIDWPLAAAFISEKDKSWPLLEFVKHPG